MNTVLAALVNGILVSAGLTLAVSVALQMTPRNSLNAATRYAIWWAVFGVTICLPVSYFRVGRTKPAAAAPTISMSAAPTVQTGIRIASSASLTNTLSRARTDIPRIHFPLTVPASGWPASIPAVWLLSAALMMIRLIASAVILERRKARAAEPPPALAARVAHWIATCGGSNRRIRLNISSEISVPLVCGPRRASILLPERLLGELSEQDLEQIGIHEAAHLVRYDDYALSIQRLVQALFALHPVVHWISRRIDLEREIACDDFVIAANNNPQPYAACLARVVELSGGIRATPVAAAAAEDNSHLARRVEMLLDRKRHTAPRLLGARLALALTCITALALGAIQIPRVVSFSAVRHDEPHVITYRAHQPLPLMAQAPVPAVPAVPAIPAVPAEPAVPAQPAVPPDPPTPPTPPETVYVPVDVRDPLGRFVTGIHQDAFRIQEDGVEQVITELSASEDTADLFVLLGTEIVPDEALRSLLAERLPVNAADTVIRVVGRLSQQTTLPEAVTELRNRLPLLSARQAVAIVINSAVAPRPSLGRPDMPVYIIDISGPDPALAQFATESGGEYVAVKRQEDVPDQVSKVVIAIRNMYFLGYTPRNNSPDGGYRKVQVTLNTPRGLPPLTARTPPGYTAPTR